MSKIINNIRRINRKDAKYILIAAIAVIALLVYFHLERERSRAVVLIGADVEVTVSGVDLADADDAVPAFKIVYISGEVHYPGVFKFELNEDVRIFHIIEKAGGKTDAACPNAINLAAPVQDGQHIIVFNIDDSSRPKPALTGQPALPGLININTATYQELQVLHAIGSARATAIIRHREVRGGFNSIEEIMNVSGIGQSIFDGISDRITVQ